MADKIHDALDRKDCSSQTILPASLRTYHSISLEPLGQMFECNRGELFPACGAFPRQGPRSREHRLAGIRLYLNDDLVKPRDYFVLRAG